MAWPEMGSAVLIGNSLSRISSSNESALPVDYSTKLNRSVKVLDFVKSGGPTRTELSLSQKSLSPCLRQNGATTGVIISESTAIYDY